MAQELQVQMVRELLDDMGPPPGLAPSDTRPGPQQRPNSNDDPYSDIELGDFFQPSSSGRRMLQRRTPPPPPPLSDTSSLSSIPEESFSL
eukprot:2789143-Alexandrium_andersonii.AAC.1